MIKSFSTSGRSSRSACTTGASRPQPFRFPKRDPTCRPQYVGLTNQQLWDRFGKALGGEVAPADVYTLPYIQGGLIPLNN